MNLSNEILAAILGLIGGLLATASVFYFSWRRIKPELDLLRSQARVNETQVNVNESESEVNISEAAKNSLSLFQAALDLSEKQNKQLKVENEAFREQLQKDQELLKQSTDAILVASAQNNKLADRITELERKEGETLLYRSEREGRISALEQDVRNLFQQVQESESKIAKYKQIIEILIKALDDAQIPVPSEVANLLGDSIKFKWPKSGAQ